MATTRNKKKARQVRNRTAVRKVVRKIRKAESDLIAPDGEYKSGSPEYWRAVADSLSVHELRIAINHVNRYNASENSYGRVDLFHVMEEAIKDALLEKEIGLE